MVDLHNNGRRFVLNTPISVQEGKDGEVSWQNPSKRTLYAKLFYRLYNTETEPMRWLREQIELSG